MRPATRNRLSRLLIVAGICWWVNPIPGPRIDAAEIAVSDKDPCSFPLPLPSQIGAREFSKKLKLFLDTQGYKSWYRDKTIRSTGPYIEGSDYGTHTQNVKIFYSPEVWSWMRVYDRKGQIPDGAMIIKAMYTSKMEDADPSEFTIMVRDKKGSWDGWFWTDGQPLLDVSPESLSNSVYNYDFYPNAGFGLYCVNCHASADNTESTYSALRNITGLPITYLTVIPTMQGYTKAVPIKAGIHARTFYLRQLLAKAQQPVAPFQPAAFARTAADYWGVTGKIPEGFTPTPLPFKGYDHVVQGPRPDGQKPFLTSDQCIGCHDATANNAALPNMIYTKTLQDPRMHAPKLGGAETNQVSINLSPYGEWRYSMMGLSGRDPVFYAQLETEREIHKELSLEIDNKCLRCHGVMGQRQNLYDQGPMALLSHDVVTDKTSRLGALARDGVSCTVCHRILADGLGTPGSYTGEFKLSDFPRIIYGPYDDVVTYPMLNSVGLTPQYASQISQSKMCGSCHTVVTPVLDVDKKYTREEFDHPKESFHEQSTYLEWKNSIYSDELKPDSVTARSCQSCHMPTRYDNRPLNFRVANIEDDTLPFADNRAADTDLRLKVRGPDSKNRYSRHSLHGINVFVTEMFNQNPWLLGIPAGGGDLGEFGGDYLVPLDTKAGIKQARNNGLELAQKESATVEITSLRKTGAGIEVGVKVSNLAGHKLPSGVGFRRAFIELSVRVGEERIWTSGATDSWGVIGTLRNGEFKALPTEFFEKNQFQPHHTTITNEAQVQIYEELLKDSKGNFTTSFLSLKKEIKDNRLMPKGWSSSGPDARDTAPRGVSQRENPEYFDGSGTNVVHYVVPIPGEKKGPIKVTATLYYQSLPPYYLKQRFRYIDKPDTRALFYFISTLKTEGELKDWKLKIADAAQSLP